MTSEVPTVQILKNVMLRGELTDITIEDGLITSIEKTDSDGLDCGGLSVYPGLIDTHSHGVLGLDASDMSCDLETMAQYELEHGITTWYPTTVTISGDDLEKLANRDISNIRGAHIPGFHMEGPFINEALKGAQNGEYCIPASMELFERCAKNGQVKKITVAPETEGALDFIEKCPVVVSIGHMTADYETCMEAFRRGAKCITHTYNTMPGIHHRKPGPIGAGSDSEGVFAELIADGIHVHPSSIRMLVKIFGEDRIVLISDSVRPTGLGDGEYELGGIMTTVKDGVARTPEGNLAGSTANLFDCVKKMIEFGYSPEVAVKMASENPARLMGLNKGKIAVGYDADLILVDSSFNLKLTVLGGEVYGK
jgi:N-acetylglucosamine-6-phosphate deacetylase